MMIQKWLVLLMLMALIGSAAGQSLSPTTKAATPEEQQLLKNLNSGIADKSRVEVLLKLSKFYIVRPGELKEDLDKGMAYAARARDLSEKLKYPTGYNDAILLMGHVSVERGDSRSMFKTIEEANDATKIRLWLLMSYYYYFGGQLTESLDSAFYCAREAKRIGEKLGPENEMTVHLHFLELYNSENDTKNAMHEYGEIIRLSKTVVLPDMHLLYARLGSMQMASGNFNLALYYALEALKNMQQTGNYKKAEVVYELLGYVCRNTGQFQRAADSFEMAVAVYKKNLQTLSIWDARENKADALRKANNNQEALRVILQTTKEFPPADNNEKQVMMRSLANCYKALKQYDLAEKYFLEMIEAGKKKSQFDRTGYRDIGQFYIEQGRFETGAKYIKQVIPHIGGFSLNAQAHIYYLLYKVDSAAGDYLSALNYLVKNKKLDDSVWEESKSRHIREIQIQYETGKKDQELKLKEQNILLLSRQAQLQQKDFEKTRLALQYEAEVKEQNFKLIKSETRQKDKDLLLQQRNIELLQKEALLKQSSLSEANFTKNVTIAGMLLIFVIMILLYNQYRVKKRNSREANIKNIALENLVSEKELLLKEVHHRVKNNLQTIISLLETQSMYLKDDALIAVQNSQHRVYAMSLIHQKLYQLDNSTSIDMAIYLPELLNYLQESFDVRKSIRFSTNIEHIHLDISQAIPAGLILNEAITNSIKYAFPGKSQGLIEIEMIRTQEKKIRFSVADNGIGLALNWQLLHLNSLGLKLMKGLSEDIQADFSIESEQGTKIIVEFEKHVFSANTIQNVNNKSSFSYS